MSRQVLFMDLANNSIIGGIELDNGDVLCGCCGGIFEKDEEGENWKIIKRYDTWIDLSETICGDDINAEFKEDN